LTRFLGRGGFGQVWEAKGPGGIDVALKIISLEDTQGLKEFRAVGLVKKLRHINLVPLYAYWLKDEYGNYLDSANQDSVNLRGKSTELVIAMGLGDKSLAQRLDECQKAGQPGIPVTELLDYMAGAARAIDYLNQPTHVLDSGPPAAIQHCDIKPGNLLIVSGSVQVCDYGLARTLSTDARRTTRPAGTPAYSAPELFANKPSAGTDQYSLAISYYELRTGKLPFEESEAVRAHVVGDLDLSQLPPAEREVIRRATHVRPGAAVPQHRGHGPRPAGRGPHSLVVVVLGRIKRPGPRVHHRGVQCRLIGSRRRDSPLRVCCVSRILVRTFLIPLAVVSRREHLGVHAPFCSQRTNTSV
jgi:serine/threonine protein kinase